jgi:hypothetical protein
MKKILMILLFSVFLISACKKDKHENNNNNNNNVKLIQLNSFPLEIGYEWEYYSEISANDSTGFPLGTDYWKHYWKVISDTSINGIPSVKIMQLDSSYHGKTLLHYTYYANKFNGFYEIAYINPSSMFYIKSIQKEYFSDNSIFHFKKETKDNSIIILNSPYWFLKFPSLMNDTWFTFNNALDAQIRKYNSYETIDTWAGKFDCIKLLISLKTNKQMDTTRTIYQYFSKKGLILETESGLVIEESKIKFNRTTELVKINF